jgi:hypothetical protein
VFVDVYDKPYDATIPYDATFFESLDRFVQAEPWQMRDKVMIEYLKTIGIEKGQPFKPDEKTKRILSDAAREAQAVPTEFRRRMIELVRAGRTPERLAKEFQPSAQTIRNWASLRANRDAGQGQDG